MNYRKIINEMLVLANIDEIPLNTMPQTFHVWKGDIDSEKDWDDFVGGQLTNHTYYKESFKGAVDLESLQFGTSPKSFYSMLTENSTIELYTSKFIELTGKFVSIGNDIETKYLAISVGLSGYNRKEKKEGKAFAAKIVLVNLVKYLSDQLDDDATAPTINIANGKMGETIQIPQLKKRDKDGDLGELEVEDFEIIDYKNEVPNVIEVLIPTTAAILGHDQVNNKDGTPLTDYRVKPTKASTNPKHFPINPLYAIMPTQFAIHSIDNYGFSHQNDVANAIKTLLATQSMGAIANTASSTAGSVGIIGKIGSAITSGVIGLSQKFFGDKGTLANSSALSSQYASSDGSVIKFFIQGDGASGDGSTGLSNDGYLKLETLKNQHDYLEVNQGNGQFGKYGKSMSPSQNAGFNGTTIYRALNLETIKLNEPTIPALATPFATGIYQNLKINDDKINNFLSWGCVRQHITTNALSPMIAPEHFLPMFRNMFFRPDPYSFWNWPTLIPAEMAVYDVEQKTSIAYDTKNFDFKESFGVINQDDNSASMKSSYFNKSILLEQITKNDLYDPNKTFVSMRFEFKKDELKEIYQSQLQAFTASIVEYKFIKAPTDENGAVIDGEEIVLRHHKYNSQGKNVGTSASILSVFQH